MITILFCAVCAMCIYRISTAQDNATPDDEIQLLPGMPSEAEQDPTQQPRTTPAGTMPPKPVIRFNSSAPSLVTDAMSIPRLKSVAPQWAVQQIEWIAPKDLEKYRGRASPEQLSMCMEWIMRTLQPQVIPGDLISNLIPLRNWAILYRDWIDHGGSDTFVVKYAIGNLLIRISDTPNYVIIAIRDLEQQSHKSKENHVPYVYQKSLQVLAEEVQPENLEAIGISEDTRSGSVTVGFWSPKGAALPEETGETEAGQSVQVQTPSDSVKFFTNGDFVIFEIFKFIWTGEMESPFDTRFTLDVSSEVEDSIWDMVEKQLQENPDLKTPEQRIKFYERMKTRLITKQVEEYLGPLLYDYQGNKLTATIPISQIESAFNELNDIQKNHLLKQRKSDESYVEGLKSFNEKRYDIAVNKWAESLSIDPMNVRCALLLNVATDFLKEKMFETLGKVDYENPTLAKAVNAQLNHKQAILKYTLSYREDTLKDREIAKHRVMAIDHYSRGEYEKAIEEWNEVLKIAPNNPQAALFKDLAIKRMNARDTLDEKMGEDMQ